MPRKSSKMLTESEARLMDILWERGESTVTDVVNSLAPEVPLAYTTVLTTLRILEEKGYISHTKQGRAHLYFPLVDRKFARGKALKEMLSRFFNNSPEQLLVNMIEEENLSKEDLERIRSLVSSDKDEGR